MKSALILPVPRSVTAALLGSLLCALAGCGGSTNQTTSTSPPPPVTTYVGAAFTGNVMAGSQPLSGASVQLYVPGSTGTTSAATALLSTALTTDASGSFSVAAGYACPTSASLLYLVARGGKIASGSTNTAIVLLTPLGACGQIASSAQFVVNEVTTTASAWALNQFLTTDANLAASATNAQGLSNAMATAASLANINTGAAPGATFPATGTAPTARINTIANLLDTCAASTTGSACGQIFSATTLTGSIPSNTLDAALNIVRSPGNNVAQLFTLASASAAFTPTLAAAPPDWTLYVTFTGGMSEPTTLGIDSTGSIWVASYPGENIPSVAYKFSPTGQPVFPAGITGSGLSESYGLAIDAQDNVWISNQVSPGVNSNQGSITELNSAGQPLSGATGYTAGYIDFPAGISIDTNGNVWVVDNAQAHVTLLSSTGQSLSGTTGYTNLTDPSTGPTLAFPASVAVDANHNAWVGDQGDGTLSKITTSGQITGYGCCDAPTGLAIDQAGNIWAANFFGNTVTELSSAGAVLTTTAAGGGLVQPQGIAVDGSGTVWVTSYHGTGLFQLAGAASNSPGNPISPAAGWAPDAAFIGAYSLAIDAAGDLWVSNFFSNSLTEVVGLAAPVKTPTIGPAQTP